MHKFLSLYLRKVLTKMVFLLMFNIIRKCQNNLEFNYKILLNKPSNFVIYK